VKLSLITFLFAVQLFAEAQATRPVPPGVRHADQIEAQSEKSIPPTLTPRRNIDLGKLKQDADELAGLAQSVPQDIDQTAKGVLPKDLNAKLKRIEKLAKQLRSQVTP
jgi:HAMP domain-containing protein